MHVQLSTALVIVAVVSSIVLVLDRGDKIVPLIAAIAAIVEALMVFGIIQLSVATFRMDVILPALLVVASVICWGRSSSKPTTTAATALASVGFIQLLSALSFLT